MLAPDGSTRCTGTMFVAGRFTPPFSALILASFHFVTLPRKMSASNSPVRRSCPSATPGRFTNGTTGVSTVGNWVSWYSRSRAGRRG